jgi:hypothetical protein
MADSMEFSTSWDGERERTSPLQTIYWVARPGPGLFMGLFKGAERVGQESNDTFLDRFVGLHVPVCQQRRGDQVHARRALHLSRVVLWFPHRCSSCCSCFVSSITIKLSIRKGKAFCSLRESELSRIKGEEWQRKKHIKAG